MTTKKSESTEVKYDAKTSGQIVAYEKMAESLKAVNTGLREKQSAQPVIKQAATDLELSIQGQIVLLHQEYEKGKVSELLKAINKSENPDHEFMKAIRTAYMNCVDLCRKKKTDAEDEAKRIEGEIRAHSHQVTSIATFLLGAKAEAERKDKSKNKRDAYREARQSQKAKQATETKKTKKTKQPEKPTKKAAKK